VTILRHAENSDGPIPAALNRNLNLFLDPSVLKHRGQIKRAIMVNNKNQKMPSRYKLA